jgi:hypothetical protein
MTITLTSGISYDGFKGATINPLWGQFVMLQSIITTLEKDQ